MTSDEIKVWQEKWFKGVRYTPGELGMLAEALITVPVQRADEAMRRIIANRDTTGRIPVSSIIAKVASMSEAQRCAEDDVRNPWHDGCPKAFRDIVDAFEFGRVTHIAGASGAVYRILTVCAAASGELRWALRVIEEAPGARPSLIWQDQIDSYQAVGAATNGGAA